MTLFETRYDVGDTFCAGDIGLLESVPRQGGHGQRNVLQVLRAVLRGHDDLFQNMVFLEFFLFVAFIPLAAFALAPVATGVIRAYRAPLRTRDRRCGGGSRPPPARSSRE